MSISSTKEIVTFINTIEQKLNHLTRKIDQWKVTLDSIDSRFNNIKKHLNITPPQLQTPIAVTNATHPKLSNNIPSRLTFTIAVTKKPAQIYNNSQHTPIPAIIPPVASTSTTDNNNNNNNSPTVQGLANEFNTMQGDVSSLKSMLSNLTSMLQNAIGQPQESIPSSTN